MGTLEERVAFVEGKLGEQSIMIEGIRQAIGSLESRLDARLNGLDQRLIALEARLDQRFSAIDQRFSVIDQRFTAMDGRFDALDVKMTRQFQWVMGGILLSAASTIATILSALLARL